MSSFPYLENLFDPIPDPAAVIQSGQVRFTVLTSRLIRMEWSPDGSFEDRASQAFWFRRQPVTEFSINRSDNRLEIDTGRLHLVYSDNLKGFTPQSLSVLVRDTGQTWRYGDSPRRARNLEGTARTLDEAKGAVRLEPGLVSRAGWAVVDDSLSLVFNQEGWLEPRDHPENLDLYFFGYGHDYPGCLKDFSLVAGQVPLLPRWILGNWWSRYWAYTQDELLDLMEGFRQRQIPLSVCIVDMDWHITQTGNRSSGWTGYTWNRQLFPDPEGFIRRLHELGLRTALNLHPAEGVHPHEQAYPEMAAHMGIDPEEHQPVPFDCADPHFMRGYFDLLHHPLEAQGVDFWWLDWQQGASAKIPGLDPLWWLNHLHFYDSGRDGVRRPFVFSRWGGLGNHRYPIGFSGDTWVTWESLQNQPGFTATAANVGFGWWSHDIGGHMKGIEDDQLYTRWTQYGVFSPIFRLHSTNNPFNDRRPWGRGLLAERLAVDAMCLRWSLIPYIYSMAWRHHTASIPLILPMYYSHPESQEAYEVPQQYWFGSELLAAPFTSSLNSETGLSCQTVWLPDGMWINFFTGERLSGGWRNIYGDLAVIPVYARPGAIVPVGSSVGFGNLENPPELQVLVFPGADNRFELVEDDGETTAYQRGEYAVTLFTQEWQDQLLRFTIHPVRGDPRFVPQVRRYQVSLRGVVDPDQVQLWVNGEPQAPGFFYDRQTETLHINQVAVSPADELVLEICSNEASLIQPRDRSQEIMFRFLNCFHLDSLVKQRIHRDWSLIQSGKKSLHAYPALTDAQFNALQTLL